MAKDIAFFYFKSMLNHSCGQKIAETERLLLKDIAKATVYYLISVFTVFVQVVFIQVVKKI